MQLDHDPDLIQITEEYIDSFQDRLENLQFLMQSLSVKSTEAQNLQPIQYLVHKLAGSAHPYGFPVLSQIASGIDHLISIEDSGVDFADLHSFLGFLEEALTLAIQTRKDPSALAQDPRMLKLCR